MTATGQTIRHLRSAQGISLRELARLIGVSPATLSAIETGGTGLSVSRLQAIATALDTSAAALLAAQPAAEPGTAQEPAAPEKPAAAPGDGAGPGAGAAWRHYPPLDIDPVMAAAIAGFVETGYHGATMRSLAQRAGMSVPGVYHHYRSKQDLLVAVLDLTMADLLERTRAARDEGRTPTERIALIVESLALFHMHRRELAFIGASEMRSLEPANRLRIAALRNDVQHLLDHEIAQAVAEGSLTTASPRVGARAIATMCTSLPQWFNADGPVSAEEIAADYAEFALGLLGHRPDTG